MSTTGPVTIQAGTSPFICGDCGRRYDTGDELVQHQSDDHDVFEQGYVELQVAGETVRACIHCLRTFDDNAQLVDHLTDEHDHFTRVLLEEGSTHG